MFELPSLETLRLAAEVLFSDNRWLDAVVEQAHERLSAAARLQQDLPAQSPA